MRSSSSTGTVRWFRPTTTRDMPGGSPWLRPRARRGSGRACRNRAPTANRRLRLERPAARSSSRASDSRSSRVAYSGPSSSPKRRRSQVARAGLRPPVPMVTTRSPWRTTDMRVNEQLAGSSAEFTQIRRASPASNTAWSTAGIAGGGGGEPGAVEVGGAELALGDGEPAGVGPGPHLVADRRARPRAPSAPASSSASILRAAMRPAPTTTQRRPATTRFDRVAGDRRRRRPAHRRARRLAVARSASASAPSRVAVGRRTGSAARSRGRPCAARPRSARSRRSARSSGST